MYYHNIYRENLTSVGLAQARPNYSEKLRKPFWNGSAISNAASLYVVSKVEISANSLTMHIKLKHFRSAVVVRTILLKTFYQYSRVLADFHKFH